ncbi:phosphopyruvate hydratase [Flexivirga caeni]|uniref:Enolase n=2 Tax=Flexivirga caeni TaxID=2294115 RepID=A0A3M9MJW1_9MICO|nr:phosphopyruvate hydratase [Flexivirga caeni]
MTTNDGLRLRSVTAEQILDSRGHPTLQVQVVTDDGASFSGSAPAGASTGDHEARELRDGGSDFGGRGVTNAVTLVADQVEPLLTGTKWVTLDDIDGALYRLDGTGRFAKIGANTAVAVSIACARAFAHQQRIPLHEWISDQLGTTPVMPVPHFNVVNGGAHAANGLAFQEFLVAPTGARDISDAVQMGAEIYAALEAELRSRFGSLGVGDEGGFAPDTDDENQVLDTIMRSIERAGLTPGLNVRLALDAAANSFYDGKYYRLHGRWRSADDLLARYVDLAANYPIWSIEDPFDESDRNAWHDIMDRLGDRVQILGDDIFVTDAARIRAGAKEEIANAALIKPNQIGTVTQTFEALRTAREVGFRTMISHRSGETLDTFIADLAVGAGTGQIKAGAPARGERVAKYNRLTRLHKLYPQLGYAQWWTD